MATEEQTMTAATLDVQSRHVDLLHPFASLDWNHCRKFPERFTRSLQAVLLEDKVYVGGSTSDKRSSARIYIYSPSTDVWSVKDTPVYEFVIVAYKSQLLLVGGREYAQRGEREFKNKIFSTSVLEKDVGSFKEFLPPMTRVKYPGLSAVSHEDYLLVADGKLGEIDVYDSHKWTSAQVLPKEMTHQRMNSVVCEGRWYLTGDDNRIHYAPIESLVASSQVGGSSSIWKSLPDHDLPCKEAKLTFFGGRLIAVGKEDKYSISAYSFDTEQWTYVFDQPAPYVTFPFAVVVLTSGELMIVDGLSVNHSVVKATLKMTSFDQESLFTMKAVHLLEAAGIPLMSKLDSCTEQIQNALNITQDSDTDPDADSLLKCWLSDPKDISPTWKNFLQMVRQLGLEDLAQQTETYLSTAQAFDSNVGMKDIEGSRAPPPSKRQRSGDTGHGLDTKLAPPPLKRQRSGDTGHGLDTKLGFELHSEVCGYLRILEREQIRSVGGALGLAYFNLQQMKELPEQMVAAWFRKEEYVREEPTWRILVEALKTVGQTGVAEKIEQEKTN